MIISKSVMVDIPKRLKKIRKLKGMTQANLAERSNISATTIARLEVKFDPTVTNVMKLCGALETTPDKLLGYEAIKL